ncbi:acetamidase/formamidase family protein [bacterium]|jgi:acetamidase/formamidase|nr:acetamidase/formamidase family protein [bacterium]|tara:strand:- start:2662 stop:3573 length:912 start_codon:yes stop_codon:yes gene_type:complete
MRRFNRTPHYTGPDDPEIGEVRGTLQLDETVIIETIGGADNDYEAAGFLKAGQIISGESHRRYARPGGPFHIEGIEPDDWVAIEIIDMEVGPYGFYRNGGPNWGNWRCLAPVRDGLVHFPPDFVVPARPMIGVVQLESWAPNAIDHGGNMDFNAIQPGSTVHIRAQKPGGGLYLGDVHARMGDGELTGAGVEIDSAITLKVSRSPGFPCSSPVVETTTVVEGAEEWLTSAKAVEWGDALKAAWLEMVALLIDRYDTTYEYANMIVGTIGDARPGFATGYMGSYVTVQIAVTKELRRTGEPYVP